MQINGRNYTQVEIMQRVGRIHQVGGTRHLVMNEGRSKGVAAIEVNTGSGFVFTLLPDRALDIASATYKGINLVFLTPNAEVHPSYYEPHGSGWLRTFFGGLLTTCGLTYLGQPGKDGSDELGLHGRIANIPASSVCDLSGWCGDEYNLVVTGTVEECVIFGDKLRMTRTIRTRIGYRCVQIQDRVENFGYRSSPFTILYHINAGFPLVDEGSELIVSQSKVTPYDARSRENMGTMYRFSDPVPGFEEENFLHEMKPDAHGIAHAALVNRRLNDGLGLFIRFHTATLPILNEWKMMGQGDYVVGIEPSNVPCLNRARLREEGCLPLLEPGEIREMQVEIGVLEGQHEIDSFPN